MVWNLTKYVSGKSIWKFDFPDTNLVWKSNFQYVLGLKFDQVLIWKVDLKIRLSSYVLGPKVEFSIRTTYFVQKSNLKIRLSRYVLGQISDQLRIENSTFRLSSYLESRFKNSTFQIRTWPKSRIFLTYLYLVWNLTKYVSGKSIWKLTFLIRTWPKSPIFQTYLVWNSGKSI